MQSIRTKWIDQIQNVAGTNLLVGEPVMGGPHMGVVEKFLVYATTVLQITCFYNGEIKTILQQMKRTYLLSTHHSPSSNACVCECVTGIMLKFSQNIQTYWSQEHEALGVLFPSFFRKSKRRMSASCRSTASASWTTTGSALLISASSPRACSVAEETTLRWACSNGASGLKTSSSTAASESGFFFLKKI